MSASGNLPKLPAERTGPRQRVLDAARALFNDRAPAQVTTAEIAEAAGMAEGNLHYHFRRKADLLTALYDAYEAEVAAISGRDFGPPDAAITAYAEHQRDWFRLMWTHRWFYRDTAALFAIAPDLRARVRTGTLHVRQAVGAVFAGMIAAGLLRATPTEAERLLDNVWIVSTHWIDYLHLTTGRADLRADDFEWGYGQVFALYAPFLTPKGRAMVRRYMARPPEHAPDATGLSRGA